MLDKKAAGFVSLAIIVAVLVGRLPVFAQFIPCRIVNLKLTPPSSVEAGQFFQVISNPTISCDPSVLPIVRADLLDVGSSHTISSTSVPYYIYTSSFTVSLVNQGTARALLGDWALQLNVYVINVVNGQAAASASQLFHVLVEPYTPPVSSLQANMTSTQTSIVVALLTNTTQLKSANATQEMETETLSSSTVTFNTAETGSLSEFLVPLVIIIVGVAIFGFLAFAGHRRDERHTASVNYCKKCGSALADNQSYCTNCGTKQVR